MKGLFKSVMLIVCVMFTTNVKCQDSKWVFVGESKRDYSKYYISNSIVKRYKNGDIKIWVKTERPVFITLKDTWYNVTALELYNVNCKNKSYEMLESTIRDSNGVALHSAKVTTTQIMESVQDSNMEGVVTKICEIHN